MNNGNVASNEPTALQFRPHLGLSCRNLQRHGWELRPRPVFGGSLQHDFSRRFVCLQDSLSKTVEQAPLRFLVGLLAIRISVTHANESAFAPYSEVDWDTSCRDMPPLDIESFNSNNRYILAVGIDFCAV